MTSFFVALGSLVKSEVGYASPAGNHPRVVSAGGSAVGPSGDAPLAAFRATVSHSFVILPPI